MATDVPDPGEQRLWELERFGMPIAIPEALTNRAEGPGDEERIRAVHREAFGQENEARLVDALRGSEAWIPGLSIVAELQADIVGHILLSSVLIEPGVAALALAPIGVRPAYQRRGVGSWLVREGLCTARAQGHRIVVVLGHPEYYPRFGFERARARGILPPRDWPDEAWMVCALRDGALDGIRGVVRYPPPFDVV